MFKKCTCCQLIKSVSDFYTDKSRGSGIAASCKECSRNKRKSHYKNNKEETSSKNKEWKLANNERVRETERAREKKRNATDPVFRIKKNIRLRLNKALKGKEKVASSIEELGCSPTDLVSYLETLFSPGMSWGNYGQGSGKWEIDHIKPLFKFDLTDIREFKEACHFTNLMPLWHEAHKIKTAKDLKVD